MSPLAHTMRTAAERLTAEIDRLRAPRQDNTPKRALQARSRAIDADHLDRVRRAALKLAEAWEACTVPPMLMGIKTKAHLVTMLKTRVEHPSYYVVVDTGTPTDTSPAAEALRAWLADRPADPAQAQAQRVAALMRDVQFQPIPGYFPTPAPVRERMLQLADLTPGLTVLEPSAGSGELAEALEADPARPLVRVMEINAQLRRILEAKGMVPIEDDFEAVIPSPRFDRVVMNPPFENSAAYRHVRLAFEWLKPGGKIVAVMPGNAIHGSHGHLTRAFIDWLDEDAADWNWEKLPDGSFKSSTRPTGVSTLLLTVEKKPEPAQAQPPAVEEPTPAPPPSLYPGAEVCRKVSGPRPRTLQPTLF